MQQRGLGPFQVSAIGLGCMNICHAYGPPVTADEAERLLLQLAQHLERAGELESALTLYRDTRAVGSRQRQIRVLERLGQDAEALTLAEQGKPTPR